MFKCSIISTPINKVNHACRKAEYQLNYRSWVGVAQRRGLHLLRAWGRVYQSVNLSHQEFYWPGRLCLGFSLTTSQQRKVSTHLWR